MFALPVNHNVYIGFQTVLLQEIAQGVFGRASLARRRDSHAAQVLHTLYGVALLHDIEHAQRIDRERNNFAARAVIEHRRQIRRDTRNVQFALNQTRRDFVRRRRQRELVFPIGIIAAFGVGHQFDKPHSGRAFERREPDGYGVNVRRNGVIGFSGDAA